MNILQRINYKPINAMRAIKVKVVWGEQWTYNLINNRFAIKCISIKNGRSRFLYNSLYVNSVCICILYFST